jgi:hypothetical protein
VFPRSKRDTSMTCSRCGHPITKGQRYASDPCCGAPDCEHLTAVSHYQCMPVALQIIEDDYEATYA